MVPMVPQQPTEESTHNQTVATTSHQTLPVRVVSRAQKVVNKRPGAGFNFLDIFTVKGWNIEFTTDRGQICLWLFIWVFKSMLYLTILCLFLCFCLFMRSLLAWRGVGRVFNGFYRRRERQIANQPDDPNDNFWEDLFHPNLFLETEQLVIRFDDSGIDPVRTIFEMSIPLLHTNPVIWFAVLAMIIIQYHVMCFVLECLQRAKASAKDAFSQKMQVASDHQGH